MLYSQSEFVNGEEPNINTVIELFHQPLAELIFQADSVRRNRTESRVGLCTICNAKSGLCSEDCKYCAQSAHYVTNAPQYPLLSIDDMVTHARQAKDAGSQHFGIVTSGRALETDDVKRLADAVAKINIEVDIEVCASLGCLDYNQLLFLKEAGLSRYHHNIETSRRFFPSITTTHTFDDRIRTITNAAKAGLSICSGCIIGIGEKVEDRADIALTLRSLNVDSIPLNILMPISGTPLEGVPHLTVADILKTIAVFRIVLPEKSLRLAAGRESILKDFQGMAFMAGANAMMIGGYLTQRGRSAEDDRKLVEEILKAWED